MKKIFILSAFLAVISISCKKSNSGNNAYYVTANIDGTAKTFNTHVTAFKSTQNGLTVLSIVGFTTAAVNSESMSITIGNNPNGSPIVAGTYTELNTNFLTVGEYNPGSTTFFYGSGLITPPVNILTVTITSIDNNTVKGTFSGDVDYMDVATSTPGTTKKTITNGTFYANLSQ